VNQTIISAPIVPSVYPSGVPPFGGSCGSLTQ
jgi:hypothetical protein